MRTLVLPVVVAVVAIGSVARAQWDGVQMLHSGAVTNDGAGGAVDVDRDTMIVGVTGFDLPGKSGAGAAVIFRWQGTAWVEESRLTASDAGAGDRFGQSVAVEGNTAVVGAYLHDLPGKGDAGAVYVFQRSGTTWTQVAKLTASNSAGGDNLGISVDLDGDTIIAGAWLKMFLASQQGGAYVFTRSASGAWSQQAQLTDVGGSASDWFGNRVALDGDTAVIGAPGDDVIFTDRGSAHIFTRSGTVWTKRTTLDPGLGAASDFFGSFVSIHNGTVAVGAPGNDVTTNGNEGAVHVFAGSGATWSLQQKLTRAGAVPGDAMGGAVAIRGDTLVCGVSNYDGIVGTNQGIGIFFTRSGTTWSASEVFQPNETQAGASLGSSVAMSEEFVAVGATNWSRAGANFSGAAYAFRRTGGVPARTLTIGAPTPETNANFGNRMASDGTRLVIGAFNEDGVAGSNQGAVYVYRVQDDAVVLEQKLLPSIQQADAQFGRSLAIDGSTIIVGAPYENDAAADAGAAYIFVLSAGTWSQQARLPSQEPAASNLFGWSVDISANRAVVGSIFDDLLVSGNTIGNAGSADSFLRSGSAWTHEREFAEPSPQVNYAAGTAVGVDGDVVAIGIPGNGSSLVNGSVRFYRWNGSAWITFSLVQNGTGGDDFGDVISADSGLFCIGGAGTDTIRSYFWNGAVIAFGQTLQASLPGFGTYFSLHPGTLLVGAPGFEAAGAVYQYARSGNTFVIPPVQLLPGTIERNDNLGEAVGFAGNAVFGGGGGISLPGGSNQGAVRRVRPLSVVDPFVTNISTGNLRGTIAEAFSEVAPDQSLYTEFGPLASAGSFSFETTRARLSIPANASMASNQTVTLTDGATLFNEEPKMELWNRILVPGGASSTIAANDLLADLPSTIDIAINATLTLNAPIARLRGISTTLPGGALDATALEQGGSFTNFGGIISAVALNNTAGGRIAGYGDYVGSIFNSGAIDVDADTQVIGPLTNNSTGVITVFNGTLTVLGTLFNNGTIIGDVAGRSALAAERDRQGLYAGPFEDRAAQTIYAKGGIDMDEGARFQPSVGSTIRTTGSFNCGITQNLRFEMLLRTLQMNGRGGTNLEAMSTDRGQAIGALNPNLPGSFPIGTLKIGPGNPSQPTIVTIIDNRDNDTLGQAACEAVYVENLVIESGAVLNAPACRVYYKTITSRGTISTPANVLRVFGPCPADLNNDGLVEDADFSLFVVQYNALDCTDPNMPGNCAADFNSDLFVDDQDFQIFILAYNELLCP